MSLPRLVAGLRACHRKLSLSMVLMMGLALAGCATADHAFRNDPRLVPPPRAQIAPPPLPPTSAPSLRNQGAVIRSGAPSYSTSSANEYRLGVGDKIRIQVHGEPDLTMELTLSEAGVINYPFLGDIPVVGRSVSELQRAIDRGLRGDYLINPDVRVVVVTYRNFYINGEVRLPGGYPYVPGLTVRQAATLAGGFTERASMRGISVYREADTRTKLPATLDTPVSPGDTVVVEQGLF